MSKTLVLASRLLVRIQVWVVHPPPPPLSPSFRVNENFWSCGLLACIRYRGKILQMPSPFRPLHDSFPLLLHSSQQMEPASVLCERCQRVAKYMRLPLAFEKSPIWTHTHAQTQTHLHACMHTDTQTHTNMDRQTHTHVCMVLSSYTPIPPALAE